MESNFGIEIGALSDFLWDWHPWAPIGLSLLFWGAIAGVVLFFRGVTKSQKDADKELSVTIDPASGIQFPHCCVACLKTVDGSHHVTVTDSISKGVIETSLTSMYGDVIGHQVTWEIPCCKSCHAAIEVPDEPGGEDAMIFFVFVPWLASVAVMCDVFVSAGGYVQLWWIAPLMPIVFALWVVIYFLVVRLLVKLWRKLAPRDVESEKTGLSRAQASVRFSINKTFEEHQPDADGFRPVAPPHNFEFIFSNQAYGREFQERNGGIVKLK